MAKTTTKKHEAVDLLEDSDYLAEKAGDFFNNSKNRNLVFGIGGAIVLAVLLFVGYKYYNGNKNTEAEEEMFQAIYYFESDSLTQALKGDGLSSGFLDIIDDYSGTTAGELAEFYAGAIYLKTGEYENAIDQLEGFSTSDPLLQSRAYALAGDAYVQTGDYSNAISSYEKAAGHHENEYMSPLYFVKLASAYEAAGEFGKAADAYDVIITKYNSSSFLQEAKKHKARLQGLAAE